MKTKLRFDMNRKIFFLIFALLLLSSVMISLAAIGRFEQALKPAMEKKSVTLGKSMAALLTKTLDLGIPVTRLNGVEDYFKTILADNPEVLYLAITDMDGALMYQSGKKTGELDVWRKNGGGNTGSSVFTDAGPCFNHAVRIVSEGKPRAVLNIGVDKSYIVRKTKEIKYDILTVLLVSFFVAVEIVLFLISYTVTGPMDAAREVMREGAEGRFDRSIDIRSEDEVGRLMRACNRALGSLNGAYLTLKKKYEGLSAEKRVDGDVSQSLTTLESRYRFGREDGGEPFFLNLLVYIRQPFFLFIFAESLSLSFFPFYVKHLFHPVPWISKELVIGLPISIFMLFCGLSFPAAGKWSDRVGRRKPFMTGAAITAVGLVLTGLAVNLFDLLIYRSLTAVGYGIVYITCQGYITDNTTQANRTQGMGIFLISFFSGTLCGSAIGGIVSDRVGYRPTFFLSALLVTVSAVLVYRVIKDKKTDGSAVKQKLKLSDFGLVFSNRRFLSLVVFSAIPAKICLTGFLYFTGPLYLKSLGNSQSSIGRALMGYGIAMILISPLASRIADLYGTRKLFVCIGGIISGLSMIGLLVFDNTLGAVLSICLLGFAHGVGVSSQLTVVTEVCKGEGEKIGLATVIGIFRLVERVGNITGPLVAGALISIYGYQGAIAGIGLLTLGTTLCYIVSLLVPLYKRPLAVEA
jgi:MFS family permease/HAMP domain-containing protein